MAGQLAELAAVHSRLMIRLVPPGEIPAKIVVASGPPMENSNTQSCN